MNKALYCLALSISLRCPPLFATETRPNVDGILKEVSRLSGREKLLTLDRYAQLYPNSIRLIDELEKEAIHQSNHPYLTFAYQGKMIYFINRSDDKTMKVYMNLIRNQFSHLDDDIKITRQEERRLEYIRQLLRLTQVTSYLDENKFYLALVGVRQLIDLPEERSNDVLESDAYILMGTVSLYLKQPNRAAESFMRSQSLNEAILENTNISRFKYFTPLEGAGIAYAEMGNYKDALRVTNFLIQQIESEYSSKKTARRLTPDDEFKYRFFKYRAITYAALWNIKTGNLPLCRSQLDEVERFVRYHGVAPPMLRDFDIYHLVEAEYYLSVNQYSTAKNYVSRITNCRTALSNSFPGLIADLILARILDAEGRSREAYLVISELYHAEDSIRKAGFTEQAEQLQSLYRKEKEEVAEWQGEIIEQQDTSHQKVVDIIFLIALLTLIFSLLIAYLIYNHRKRISAENRLLPEPKEELEKRNWKIDELRLIHDGITDYDKSKTDSYGTLIERLDHYLTESCAYRYPDVSRKDLAAQMGTNRQYLIEAIKQKTGKTFNEYIYSYRLKFAYEQLVDNKQRPIFEILNEAGFLTRSTFYKAFKDVYGVTPNELRDILNDRSHGDKRSNTPVEEEAG